MRLLYYILFFLTPLAVYTKTSELFEFNKIMIVYAVTTVALCIFFMRQVRDGMFRFRRGIVLIPFGLFLISQILSTLFSIDLHTSLFGYYGRFNGGLISIFCYLALFYIFIHEFSVKDIPRFLQISLVTSLIVLAWALPGKFGHDLSCFAFTGQLSNSCWTDQFRPAERIFSTMGQPNWLGAYLSINFFIGLYYAFLQKQKKMSGLLQYTVVVFLFIGILFTRSDSALVATGVGFIIFITAILLRSPNKNTLFKPIAGLLLAFAISIAIFQTGISRIDRFLLSFSKQPANSLTRSAQNIYTINNITDSWDIRKIVWQGAVDIGKSHPLLGTGVETFAYSYYSKRPLAHNLTSEWDYIYNKAHNEYLNYFATTGLGGIGTYVLMIMTVIYLSVRTMRKSSESWNEFLMGLTFLTAYISILVTNFFGFSVSVINLYFYIIPGLLIVENKLPLKTFTVKIQKTKLTRVPLFIICILFGLSSLLSLFNYYIADLKYAASDSAERASDYKETSILLNEALMHHYEHVYEDKLSYALANLTYIASFEKEVTTASQLMDLAKRYNLRSLRSSPKNPFYWKTRAKNYYLFYQADLTEKNLITGLSALDEAQTLAPTDPKVTYSKALYYVVLYDSQKSEAEKKKYEALALSAVDRTLEMKPNYEDAYFLKGQLLKKFGKKEDARQVFQFILEKVNPQNEDVQRELQSF